MVAGITRAVLIRIDFLLLALGMYLLGMKEKTTTQNPVFRTLRMHLQPLACYFVVKSLERLLTRALSGQNLKANMELIDAE